MEDKIKSIVERELKAKVISIKRITEGYSHYMYLVKTDKTPFEVIVRFSNNSREDVCLEKEKFIIETLRKNRIPAPKILAFSKEYMILEKFEGERLDLIWEKLTKAEKAYITEKMGRMLKDVHSITFEEFGKIKGDGKIDADKSFKFRKAGTQLKYNNWIREVTKEFLKDYARLLSYGHVNKNLMIRINQYVLNNITHLKYIGKPVLIHGDFQKGHIFVRKIEGEYKIIGVIDFEFANSSAPEYDFIKLHREGFFNDKILMKALERGYGRSINKKALSVYRIMRDMMFAQVMLDAGNNQLADKVLKNLSQKLNS